MSSSRVLRGSDFPLGASVVEDGVNFAVFSENATAIELCLFDEAGVQTEILMLEERTGPVWHGLVPGLSAGQLYGFRAHGPFEPEAGHRFNPAKLLIDPYARALSGQVDWNAPVFGYRLGDDAMDLSLDDADDAAGVPKSVVVADDFDWGEDRPPGIPWNQTVIYEVHAKGFTVRHPGIPDSLKGTYAGLAAPAAIEHLKQLGSTAVELLPVHAHVDGKHLVDHDLTNYWGYDTIAFFAPEGRYASAARPQECVNEFKAMVKTLHEAGIEVILDVVYNHTAEGNELGPTLSFKGLDNRSYYRLVDEQPRYYMDYTGTGNTLNLQNPHTLRLVMDSLRYGVDEMHVDGFRFDLASALARELYDVNMLSSFMDAIHQDPSVSRVKLIAEPWDVGDGGYQVGNFPPNWMEWNGRYRDAIRRFWRGDAGQTAEIAYRLTGSSDLYEEDGRRPHASINFVTAHDGFTLDDLVSYNEKHNEANGENNQDGANDNNSWNCGHEGPTDDEAILALRERQKRNLLATLFFSQGVPMLLGGDEMGRTQQGNNNGYCQDNEISWFDWDLDERSQALLEFTSRLSALRREHPSLRRRKFFSGRPIRGSDASDIQWLRPDGQEMSDEEWDADWLKCFGMRLDGNLDERDEQGEFIHDDDLLLLVNASDAQVEFVLPAAKAGAWAVVVDTATEAADGNEVVEHYGIGGRCLALLRSLRQD